MKIWFSFFSSPSLYSLNQSHLNFKSDRKIKKIRFLHIIFNNLWAREKGRIYLGKHLCRTFGSEWAFGWGAALGWCSHLQQLSLSHREDGKAKNCSATSWNSEEPNKPINSRVFAHVCTCSVTSNSLGPHGLQLARLLCPWDFPGKNTGVGCHFLLQGVVPTQGSNTRLLHYRQFLDHWAPGEAPRVFSLNQLKQYPLLHISCRWSVGWGHVWDAQ